MKSFQFQFLFILLSSNLVYAQSTYIPDDNFEQHFINLGYDSILDNYINKTSIDTIINLNIDFKNINSLKGIEDFNDLKIISCIGNNLDSLDLSSNIFLEDVYCNLNNINYLFTNGLMYLKHLECWSNQITELDVSSNLSLQYLNIQANNLNNLILNNDSLKYLNCEDNQLFNLNIDNIKQIEELNVRYNYLSSLDLSNNNKLYWLDCELNQLTSIDLNTNTELYFLDCESNNINSINLNNNLKLHRLDLENNQISSIDLSNNINLKSLDLEQNLIDSLILSNNPIQELGCDKNLNLVYLDLRNGNNHNITDIVIKDNPNLNCINVDDPSYSSLNWTYANGSIDSHHFFSSNCQINSIFENKTSKKYYFKYDLLGRKTSQNMFKNIIK